MGLYLQEREIEEGKRRQDDSKNQERMAAKRPESAFFQVLKEEFNYSMRLSQDVLKADQAILIGERSSDRLRPRQLT